MSLKLQAGAVGVAMLLVFAILGGLLAYEQVPEGHVGVEKDWGAVNGDVLNPGANWIVPIMQGVQNVEVRDRTYTMSATRGEGERVGADAITVKTADGNSVEVDSQPLVITQSTRRMVESHLKILQPQHLSETLRESRLFLKRCRFEILVFRARLIRR